MKPILFNTEMVKAILGGRKTVTRRLIKPQPLGYFEVSESPTYLYDFEPSSKRIYPRYQAGDILYVRETYANISDFVNYAEYEIDSDLKYLYKCDDNGKEHSFIDVGVKRWRPSIHMPKEAARIFLKVTDVRVERLQDITEDQARNEGCITYNEKIGDGIFEDVIEFDLTAIDAFAELWNSTVDLKNKPELSWSSNPWVWVIEFERIEKPIEN